VKKSGSRVLVGFQFRFHPTLRKVKELLSSGDLGQPISARVFWGEYLPDWHPWEDYRLSYSARSDLGGGVVLTQSHPFDFLHWLFGDVNSIFGTVRRSGDLEIDVEDVAEVDLEFIGGLKASVHLDYLQKPPTNWLEIVCARGYLKWDAATGLLSVSYASGDAEEFPVPNGFERNDMFLSELHHFIDTANGKATPQCTLQDGIKALQIALAVHQSSATGQVVLAQF
jgi:predicted dehydrogenase